MLFSRAAVLYCLPVTSTSIITFARGWLQSIAFNRPWSKCVICWSSRHECTHTCFDVLPWDLSEEKQTLPAKGDAIRLPEFSVRHLENTKESRGGKSPCVSFGSYGGGKWDLNGQIITSERDDEPHRQTEELKWTMSSESRLFLMKKIQL